MKRLAEGKSRPREDSLVRLSCKTNKHNYRLSKKMLLLSPPWPKDRADCDGNKLTQRALAESVHELLLASTRAIFSRKSIRTFVVSLAWNLEKRICPLSLKLVLIIFKKWGKCFAASVSSLPWTFNHQTMGIVCLLVSDSCTVLVKTL